MLAVCFFDLFKWEACFILFFYFICFISFFFVLSSQSNKARATKRAATESLMALAAPQMDSSQPRAMQG